MSEKETVETEEDVIELELEEDRIVGYLVDEDDNEIGVLYTDDNGDEVEIYYDEIEISEDSAVGDASSDKGDAADAEDSVEMEIDPDAILYYMVDSKGNELGFVALNEAGEKEEYLYPAEAVERFYLLDELEKKLQKASGVAGSASNLVAAGTNAVGGVVNRVAGKEVVKTKGGQAPKEAEPSEDAVTKDDFKEMFSAFKDVAVEGYAAISGVMDQVDDVRDQLDDINPKKRRQKRRAEKAAAATQQPMIVQQVAAPAVSADAGAGSSGASAPAAAAPVATAPAAAAPAATSAETPASAPTSSIDADADANAASSEQ